MEQNIEQKKTDIFKSIKVSDNDRFKFVLSINGDVVCARSFKIFNFNRNAISTIDFFDCMERCVRLIQKDLEGKSRIYEWYTATLPVKLTGFGDTEFYHQVGRYREGAISYDELPATTKAEYLVYKKNPADDAPIPWGTQMFKFSFYVGEDYDELEDGDRLYKSYHLAYEREWDGSCYASTVRKYLDLSNYGYIPQNMGEYTKYLVQRMNLAGDETSQREEGDVRRKNVIQEIIRDIVETTTYNMEEYEYHSALSDYGKAYSTYASPYKRLVSIYAPWVSGKTKKYENEECRGFFA